MVIIGRIGAPYGVRGWARAHSFTDPASNLAQYTEWLYKEDGEWKKLQVEKIRPHSGCFVVKIADINDRDQVALFTNIEIAVSRDALPALQEGEHYWADLLGLEVSNVNNEYLGKITDLFATGANDVLVVKDTNKDKEHLIPYVPDDFVLSVDLGSKKMQVQWDLEF